MGFSAPPTSGPAPPHPAWADLLQDHISQHANMCRCRDGMRTAHKRRSPPTVLRFRYCCPPHFCAIDSSECVCVSKTRTTTERYHFFFRISKRVYTVTEHEQPARSQTVKEAARCIGRSRGGFDSHGVCRQVGHLHEVVLLLRRQL